MMRGIDVSNWQGGLIPSELDIDFCIAKATEGANFVDGYCDGFIQNCIEHDIPWGFYHFARENEPETEADFFVRNCTGYFGKGIAVLDYETANYNNREWCERFIDRVHDLTGVWCIIYMSASMCAQFHGSWIPGKCGLWVAGYPFPSTNWTDVDMPYDVSPFEVVALWQFTSSLQLGNWYLDGDIAYMDSEAWMKYANPDGESVPDLEPTYNGKTCRELAQEVLDGKWGNGWNRKEALNAAFGNGTYEHVQTIVNEMIGLEGC